MNYLNKILFLVKDYKKKIYLLTLLIGIGSILELASLGILVPTISYFLDDKVFYPEIFNTIDKEYYIYILLSLIFFIFISKTFFFLYLNYFKNNFLAYVAADLSKKLFSFYIKRDYYFHLKNSSPKLVGNIEEAIQFVNGSITSSINLLIDFCIAILIIIFLFNINFIITFILLLSLSTIIILYIFVFKNYIKNLGEKRLSLRALRIKFLQESFSGIREIKLFNNYNYAINGFKNANSGMLNNFSKDLLLQSVPKLIFELFIVILFLVFILFLLYLKNDYSYIAFLLSIFLISSIRILPIVNRVLISLHILRIGRKGLNTIFNELKLYENIQRNNDASADLPEGNNFFEKEIRFENVDFEYQENSGLILDNITISIPKGKIIAISGRSGSGKSTFLDIFCGLLKPTRGKIFIDNSNLFLNKKSWLNKISYVSQNIFLNEGTILENITFSQMKDPIDKILLNRVLAITGLNDFIDNLPNGILTYIGEKGIKLSGGQKQRIGIARALYRNTDILVLDEATNALDIQNEQKIIFSVKDHCVGKTLILVSHRQENLQYCDIIFKLENKKIIKQ
jgi:ABC-type bacteriocin/lantibiotic exporter with double-glycine peptidase domain